MGRVWADLNFTRYEHEPVTRFANSTNTLNNLKFLKYFN